VNNTTTWGWLKMRNYVGEGAAGAVQNENPTAGSRDERRSYITRKMGPGWQDRVVAVVNGIPMSREDALAWDYR
jgi:hypothetical protein